MESFSLYMHASKDVELLEIFTSLGSIVHSNSRSDKEVTRCVSLAWGVKDC